MMRPRRRPNDGDSGVAATVEEAPRSESSNSAPRQSIMSSLWASSQWASRFPSQLRRRKKQQQQNRRSSFMEDGNGRLENSILAFIGLVVFLSIASWIWVLVLRRRGGSSLWSLISNRFLIGWHTVPFRLDLRTAAMDSHVVGGGQEQQQHKQQPFSIFYQIFIPNDNHGRQTTLRIVQEQMKQIQSAILEQQALQNRNQRLVNLANHHDPPPVQLYYFTIGKDLLNRLKEFHFQTDHCTNHNLQCTHAGHTEKGTEDFTLQGLHEFCQGVQSHNMDNNHHHRVVYLHSKGSYHHSRVNENWRYHLTAAALHPSCLHPPTPNDNSSNDQCHVCGLQFFTEWALFFPGNIWTAQCSYVSQLLSPKDFEGAVDTAMKEVLFLKWKGVLESHLYPDRLDRFGLDRYHTEHWIASHPMVQPCDLSVTGQLKPWLSIPPAHKQQQHSSSNQTDTLMQWSMAPRHHGGPADQLDNATLDAMWQRHDARREMMFLAGLLVKFAIWYQQVPPRNSWMWTWFPEGYFWKDQILHNGVQKLLHQQPSKWMSHVLPLLPRERSKTITLKWRNESDRTIVDPVVSSSLNTNENRKEAAVYLTIHKPREQIQQIQVFLDNWQKQQQQKQFQHGSRPIVLYYQLFRMNADGGDSGNAVAAMIQNHPFCSIKSHTASTSCMQLPSLQDPRQTGETLHELHRYCHQHPESTVTYLGEIFANPGERRQQQQHFDDGVGRMLAELVQRDGCVATSGMGNKHSCNLCGLEWVLTGAGFAFRRNAWTAPCSYIKKLLSPSGYCRKMSHVTKSILLQAMKRRLVMELMQSNSSYLPTETQGLHYWVTSHPSAVPCSVSFSSKSSPSSSLLEVFEASTGIDYNQKLVADIRNSGGAGNYLAGTNESVVLRECAFLACHILRWGLLYHDFPDPSSWVWSWFPYGRQWVAAVASQSIITTDLQLGEAAEVEQIVEHVVGPFADTTV